MLDSKTLQKHLAKHSAAMKAESEYEINYWKWKAENPVAVDPNCSIGDAGLRLWNAENEGVPGGVEVR